jgi:hypothetical protein
MWFGQSLMFQRNISSPSSGLQSKPSKKLAEAGSKLSFELQDITQKTILSFLTVSKYPAGLYIQLFLNRRFGGND